VPAADFLLEHMSRCLFDPVDPTRIGSLDPKLQARVNGEIYRFAGPLTRHRFVKDPVRWCGILRDPVSAVRFYPDRFSPRVSTQESPYFFDSDSTYRVFKIDPEHYAIHRK
jgi:YHS domain-containing protein